MASKAQGFALLEVLIAMLLIAVAGLALVKMQVYTQQRSDFALNSVAGLNHIENKLERLRASSITDFAALASGSEADDFFTTTWSVTAPISALSSSLKQIEITAKWQDRLGQTQQIQLTTMIAK